MKKLLFIFAILLTSCTRYIVVLVQPIPKQTSPHASVLLPAMGIRDMPYITHDPYIANDQIDTASFLYRLNRGDFMYDSTTNTLRIPKQ